MLLGKSNGNMTYVSTAREIVAKKRVAVSRERKLLWDEEDRLRAISDNGFVSCYWYDADGVRAVKTSGMNESAFVDGQYRAGMTGTSEYTLYVSPMLVKQGNANYTKHYYAGAERIASKMVNGGASLKGAADRTVRAGVNVSGVSVEYDDIYSLQTASVKQRYREMSVTYRGTDNRPGTAGESQNGFTPEAVTATAPSYLSSDDEETERFYYHPDHLGSTSCVTDLKGQIIHQVDYIPFGEVFIEERQGEWHTPYLFNAKEYDEETGLYYYGARYYDPRLSIWISPDPMQEKCPGLSPYRYGFNNPINYIDPNGLFESESEAQNWADKNGIKIGFLRSHKIQQIENNMWAVVNNRNNTQYYKDPTLNSLDNLIGRRADGVIQSVVAYDKNPEFIPVELSHLWNSPVARWAIPDIISLGLGFSGIFGIGADSSIEANWILRGPEASLTPVFSVTESIGAGYSVDASINIGGANYIGPVNEINRHMIETSFVSGDIGGFVSFGASGGGKLGVTVSAARAKNSVIINRQLNYGAGLPMGPVPVNAAAGGYNTYILQKEHQ